MGDIDRRPSLRDLLTTLLVQLRLRRARVEETSEAAFDQEEAVTANYLTDQGETNA